VFFVLALFTSWSAPLVSVPAFSVMEAQVGFGDEDPNAWQ